MDKSKFTRDPHLDSEGFPWAVEDMQTASSWLQMHNQLHERARLRYEPWRLGEVYGMRPWAVPESFKRAADFLKWYGSPVIEGTTNPKGWQEVEGVTLPSVWSWAEPAPVIEHDDTEVKKALAEFFLNGPVQTFDGEAGTYSDPKCAKCSPWARLEQRDLDTIHQLWLAERITPHNGGTR